MPKEEFKREVEKELTGKDSEPSELIFFKVYKSQVPVIEQAIETAALMLGSDKSRGYCLEMICADFLAGAHMDGGNPEVLLQSISRYYNFLPDRSERRFFPVSAQKHHEEGCPQNSADPARFRELPQPTQPDFAARRLAMPGLRQHAEPAGPPCSIPKPVGV